MPPHISLSLSKTVFSLSRCTSPHPPAALVHECSVHSPPGVSAERKPDSQHCLPLKTPAAAFLPRGSAGTRGVGGGGGRFGPPRGKWPPTLRHSARRVTSAGRNTDIQLCSRTEGKDGEKAVAWKSSAIIKAQHGRSSREEMAAVH